MGSGCLPTPTSSCAGPRPDSEDLWHSFAVPKLPHLFEFGIIEGDLRQATLTLAAMTSFATLRGTPVAYSPIPM